MLATEGRNFANASRVLPQTQRMAGPAAGNQPPKPKIVMTTLSETALAAAQERRAKYDLPYYGAVLPGEAQALLEAFPNARLIDVRTRPELDYVGRVPGSSVRYDDDTLKRLFLDI